MLIAEYGEDPELLNAMRESMKQMKVDAIVSIKLAPEPASDVDPNLVCGIKLRCPDGSEINRNFHRETATI